MFWIYLFTLGYQLKMARRIYLFTLGYQLKMARKM